MMSLCRKRLSRLVVVPILLMLGAAHGSGFSGGQPIQPQPEPSTLNSGLAVNYFFQYFDHIRELDKRSGGKPGDPLENLDHVAFEDGKVLTTDRAMGVGAHIRGLIRLDTTGDYVFRLQSNDGVKLAIGGILLHTDPEIHAARWSPDLVYKVETPGWYDFSLDYFQRKGTSALRLKWIAPGVEEEIVPGSAFSHR